MTIVKSSTPTPAKRPARERILDASERLLRKGSPAFSMRELAVEADVSFATPFNHFGSKGAIMLALSARRIAAMHDQLAEAGLTGTVAERVLSAVEIAAKVMLSSPDVNRAVMGAISGPTDEPGSVSSQSQALWAEALGTGAGLAAATRPLALALLPDQLAFAFRGVLSFWTAGELPNELLIPSARAAAATVLLGFVDRHDRAKLLTLLQKAPD